MEELSLFSSTLAPPPPWGPGSQGDQAGGPTPLYRQRLSEVALNPQVAARTPFLFSQTVPAGPVTNQKASGRCWLFATANLVRGAARTAWHGRVDTDKLAFSVAYLFFWDKYERYHRALRYFVDLERHPRPFQDRLLHKLCHDALSDGGQWDMAAALLTKYGVVPEEVYPDSFHAQNSAGLNVVLMAQLKADWGSLRNTAAPNLEAHIKTLMQRVWGILTAYLGTPPYQFSWTHTSQGVVHTWDNLTPLVLLERTKFRPEEWVAVVHDPRVENMVHQAYQIYMLGNVHAQHVGWITVPPSRLVELACACLEAQYPVWVGCDVGPHPHLDDATGVMHPHVIDVQSVLPAYNVEVSQSDRLRWYLSVPNHAVVLTGCHRDAAGARPVRWHVENSWGADRGKQGFYVMTDAFFAEYVFQVVVHRDWLQPEETEALQTVPHVLMPWDPLGTLAEAGPA